jgi:hypothetical protein
MTPAFRGMARTTVCRVAGRIALLPRAANSFGRCRGWPAAGQRSPWAGQVIDIRSESAASPAVAAGDAVFHWGLRWNETGRVWNRIAGPWNRIAAWWNEKRASWNALGTGLSGAPAFRPHGKRRASGGGRRASGVVVDARWHSLSRLRGAETSTGVLPPPPLRGAPPAGVRKRRTRSLSLQIFTTSEARGPSMRSAGSSILWCLL